MAKRVGLFGGTFDPIHFGHLNLAAEVLERLGLDQILFCPAYISPLKQDSPPLCTPLDRLNMVMLATEEVPQFVPYDKEVLQTSPSFTIDTVKSLIKREQELYFIMAEDVLSGLAEWKDVETLFEFAKPIIGSRQGSAPEAIQKLSGQLQQKIREGMCPIPQFEISSTEVRNRLKKRLYCGHLVPGKVLDYIYQKGLYY